MRRFNRVPTSSTSKAASSDIKGSRRMGFSGGRGGRRPFSAVANAQPTWTLGQGDPRRLLPCTMGATGDQPMIELRAGALRCELAPELGGAVAGLWLGDVPVLRSMPAAEMTSARLAGCH